MRRASATQSSAAPSPDFAALAGLLACPDDGATLACARSRVECKRCGRDFRIFDDGVAELLPLRPARFHDKDNRAYWQEYADEFERAYEPSAKAVAWGAPETSESSWLQKRLRQVQAVRPLIADPASSRSQVLCDIAAGAGHYTLSYASAFRAVLHCDLSAGNLSYAARKAKPLGIRNVFFLRVDYFSPPFASAIDRIICFDTLIRGERHELALLAAIHKALRPGGQATVDFHNWWHNPARRLGLMPQNFGTNRSYGRAEVESLLRRAGIPRFDFFPFHQEFDSRWRGRRIASRVVPPTRLIYRFRSDECAGDAAPSGRRQSKFEEFHVAEL